MTVHSSKSCLFCGAGGQGVKITKEHVLPRWLRTHARVDLGFSKEIIRIGGEQIGQPRLARPFNRQARIACLACNTGWMRALEERARPLLLPMLDGLDVELSSDKQVVLAAWAVKTCYAVANSRHDFRVAIPVSHYRQLASSLGRTAPGAVGVWLALHPERLYIGGAGSAAHLAAFSTRVKTVKDGPSNLRFYGLILRISRLIIQVIGPERTDEDVLLKHVLADSYMCEIWPPSGEPLRWPPPGDLGEVGGFDALAGRDGSYNVPPT